MNVEIILTVDEINLMIQEHLAERGYKVNISDISYEIKNHYSEYPMDRGTPKLQKCKIKVEV